ncbi:GGDEF domain-containing protein [Neobacillus soli]|uniref:GGDEF domain-containing protein n=1 Tax=Neobacillus soli TaxID=220688 RepID=UPI000824BD7D|nr:GGDEF domain-containing protein [Neobacillus soli]
MRVFRTNLPNGNGQNSTSMSEFTQYNYNVLFERLKLVSYMLIFTYPAFFVVDFFLLKNLNHPTYKWVLAAVHITGLVISLLFMFIYRTKKGSKSFVVNCYILLYLLLGAVSSINSQLFTGNIYVYLIILFGVAVVIPIQPRKLLIPIIGIHGFFVTGLILIEQNDFSLLIKLINSTGTAVISFMIAVIFYTFRKNDFSNKMKLSRNEESFRRLFHLNPNPLILTKLSNDEILLMNHQAIAYYQLEEKDIAQMNTSFLYNNPEEKADILSRLEEQKVLKNYVTAQQISPNLRKWSMLHFELVDYLDESCLLIGTTDITAMKEKEVELSKHASLDALTGVMNRRSGIELLRKHLSLGTHAQQFILMFIDINNLKKVNDRYGHSIGDDLIKTCCATMNQHIDLNDCLFRFGGDEFIIVFFNKQMEDVELVWDNIRMEFQSINEINQKPYKLSASYGCYHYKSDTPITLEEIFELADQDMYKNKHIYKTKHTDQLTPLG